MIDPLDREPNYGAERAVLSAMLQNPAVIQDARDLLDLSDYRLEPSRIIARAIFALTDQGIVADEVAVLSHLIEAGSLELAGGAAYLSSLTREGVPRTDNLRGYARIVKKLSIDHQIELEREAMQLEREDGESPADSLEKHLPRLIELQRQAVGGGSTDAQVDDLGCTGAELATREAVAVDWIVPGYVAAGSLTEIIGRVKEGKTTFEMALIRACLFGGDFIGHYVDPCPVVIVTEQGEVSFCAQARPAGILGSENLTIVFKHELVRFSWEQRVNLVMAKAAKVGARTVLWDTFGAFAGLKDDGENSDEAGRKMRDLSEAAAVSRRAIVALRHARKSGGDPSDAGRGYSGISGAVDIVILLKKSATNQGPNIREIEAVSRFSETPQSAVIELVGTHYRLLGDAATVSRDRNEAAVVNVLPRDPDEGFTIQDIVAASDLTRGVIQRALGDLVQRQAVMPYGTGKKNDAKRYRLPAQYCPIDSEQKPPEQTKAAEYLTAVAEMLPTEKRGSEQNSERNLGSFQAIWENDAAHSIECDSGHNQNVPTQSLENSTVSENDAAQTLIPKSGQKQRPNNEDSARV